VVSSHPTVLPFPDLMAQLRTDLERHKRWLATERIVNERLMTHIRELREDLIAVEYERDALRVALEALRLELQSHDKS
jgi:hypothetical protein